MTSRVPYLTRSLHLLSLCVRLLIEKFTALSSLPYFVSGFRQIYEAFLDQAYLRPIERAIKTKMAANLRVDIDQ